MTYLPFTDHDRFALARAIIADAGALALRHFREASARDIHVKLNGQDVASNADREVEALIRARIAAVFPDDGFLGEESGVRAGSSDFTWVVDPIDGTSCFVHGIRSWCVSIALMRGPEAVFGLILDPCAGELFSAVKGGGAFLDDTPIRVDTASSLANGLTGLGANFRVPVNTIADFVHALLEAGGMFVRNGSGALMLAEVACGRLVAYYEPHINAWDCMAGLLIVREAGGWTADFPSGSDLLAGGPVIAAAPQVRADLSALIARVSAGKRIT